MSEIKAIKREPWGEMAPNVASFAFTDENLGEADRILAKYPPARRQSAVLPLLHLAQEQHGGWLPTAVLDYIADFLGIPKIRVYEVATFYDMYNTEPVGRVQVRVCTTTPCWLCGSDDVVRACKDALGIDLGDSTPDGRFYLREFECLGACSNAPVLWVDDLFYEDLDYDSTKAIVEALKRGESPKPGSAKGRQGSMPIGGRTTLMNVSRPQEESEAGPPKGDDQAPVEKAKPGVEVKQYAAKQESEGRPPGASKERDEGGKSDAE